MCLSCDERWCACHVMRSGVHYVMVVCHVMRDSVLVM